jgi:dolichol-phosphate mannosyltransferase
MSNRIFVVFPCYNEEEGLEKLLTRFVRIRKLSERDLQLVVVNDGSRDHTVAVARSFAGEIPMTIIDFPKNRGVAEVFNTAFARVLEQGDDNDIVVTIDSDNTMNPYVLIDILAALEHADVVIASRFVPGGGMVGAGWRAWLSHGAAWLMKLRVGLPGVSDYSIFYRGYRLAILSEVFRRHAGRPVEGAGFSCMANLLLRLHAAGARFAEVPLVLRYDLKESGSAVRIFRTIGGYLRLAFRREESTGR